MSMSGAVALDILAIHKTLDCYNVPYDEDRAELIDMVQKLSGINIFTQQAEAKIKANRK